MIRTREKSAREAYNRPSAIISNGVDMSFKISKLFSWISMGFVLASASPLLAEEATVVHNGIVIEAKNAGNYTYVQVDEAGDIFWIAAPHTIVQKGAKVSFSEQVWMYKFKSKMLNRTFDKLLFVADINVKPSAATSAADASSTAVKPADQSKAVTAKQSAKKSFLKAAGGYTIEEIFSRKDELKGKQVTVSGEVVKVSENIMGTNWIHIQDGTGEEGSDKIIFRSKDKPPAVGSTVTAKGSLNTDKDFGYGYYYSVIVEDSTFSK